MSKRFGYYHYGAPVLKSPELGNKPSIEQILDACLDDVGARHKTIADCLFKYPSHAEELFPLLRMAAEIKDLAPVTPSSTFKYAVRQQLQLPEDAAGSADSTHPVHLAVGSRLAYALCRSKKQGATF